MDRQKKKRVYDYPAYYEVAFSFRDISHEVDVLERCINLFSRIPVRCVLELGCGTAPHMVELMRRGYEYIGIDLSRNMLDYARVKADGEGLLPTLLNGNMVRFALQKQVDFVFVLLGSLHVINTVELFCHLEAVAKALNLGGIYLLDWCVQFDRSMEESESWVTERDDLRIETYYSRRFVDLVGQTFQDVIKMRVEDHGIHLDLEDRCIKRAIYPQEFILLVEKIGRFEFVGWWNNWNLDDPIREGVIRKEDNRIKRPMILIRRT